MYWRSGPSSQSQAISQASVPARVRGLAATGERQGGGRAQELAPLLELLGERGAGDRAVGALGQLVQSDLRPRQIEGELVAQPLRGIVDRLLDPAQRELAQGAEGGVGGAHHRRAAGAGGVALEGAAELVALRHEQAGAQVIRCACRIRRAGPGQADRPDDEAEPKGHGRNLTGGGPATASMPPA